MPSRKARAFLVALLACAAPAMASADNKKHGSIAAGSLLEVTEPVIGAWAGGDFWPGGVWGMRADFFYLDFETWLVEASAVRQLGASRPHLVMSLHFGAGYAESEVVTLAAGMTTQLGLKIGPLALVSDVAVHGAIGDGTFDVLVTGVAGLAAAF